MYSIPSLRSVFAKSGLSPAGQAYPFYANGQIITQAIASDNIYIGGDFTSVGKYSDLKSYKFCILNSTTADANYISINKTLFNGDVECSVISGSYIYVGGSFTLYNNQPCGFLAKISLIDGSVDPAFDIANGFNTTVKSIALDGLGSIFVGGNFSLYKGTSRANIAKISATTAALDTTFNSATGFNGTANSIIYSSGNIIVGGFFTTYKGTGRQYIAKLNATTAALDGIFDTASAFNQQVKSLALDGSGNIYAAGDFTAYKGTTRQRIAKIDPTTSALDTTFNAATGFDGTVNSIALDGSGNLYCGGQFNLYKGIGRQQIAKLNATTAALDTTFNSASGFNLPVSAIALDGSGNIYAGGQFSSYKGASRGCIAKLNATTAALDTTFDSANGFDTVFSVGVSVICLDSSGNLFAGGAFTKYKTLNKQVSRQRIAKISLLTGNVDTTFDTENGFSNAISVISFDSSGNLYVGGYITSYKGTAVQMIAKLNPTTAALDTTFNTSTGFDSTVYSLAFDGSGNIYAGGAFTSYKGTTRQRIAKLNATTAALDTTFDAASGFDNQVFSIALDGSGSLYAGGAFITYKGTTRQYIAKINATTAASDTTFNSASGFNTTVRSIALDSSGNFYAGGDFTTYKGTTRQFIAKLNTTTAALDTTFNSASGFDNVVNVIALDGSGNLYAGGSFTSYKATTRQRIAKINATNAALNTTFNTLTGFNNAANSIVLSGSLNIYVGGQFTNYKNIISTSTVILDSTTAAAKGY